MCQLQSLYGHPIVDTLKQAPATERENELSPVSKAQPMPTNDNDSAVRGFMPQMPDPHGQAALLLVESLIHGLLSRSVISLDDAIEIVETADDVQVEVAEAADGHGAPMWRAHALLSGIAESLKLDQGGTSKHDGDGSTSPFHDVP